MKQDVIFKNKDPAHVPLRPTSFLLLPFLTILLLIHVFLALFRVYIHLKLLLEDEGTCWAKNNQHAKPPNIFWNAVAFDKL